MKNSQIVDLEFEAALSKSLNLPEISGGADGSLQNGFAILWLCAVPAAAGYNFSLLIRWLRFLFLRILTVPNVASIANPA